MLKGFAWLVNYAFSSTKSKLVFSACLGLIVFFGCGMGMQGAVFALVFTAVSFVAFALLFRRVSEVMIMSVLSHTMVMNLKDAGRYDSYDFEDVQQRRAAAEDFYEEFRKAILDCGAKTVRFSTHGKAVQNVVLSEDIRNAFEVMKLQYKGESNFTLEVLIMTHGRFQNMHPRQKYEVVLRKIH